jgi:hypothetical protein
MDTQTVQAEPHESSVDPKICCTQKCLADPEAHIKCKGCQDKNCGQCGGRISKSNQMATLGVAACVGYFLGWLLEKKK